MSHQGQEDLECHYVDGLLVEVLRNGGPVRLSQRERSLLAQFVQAPGGVVLRDRLMLEQETEDPAALHNWIHRLRKKLGPDRLQQVGGRSGHGAGAGSGYRLVGFCMRRIDLGKGLGDWESGQTGMHEAC